MASIKKYSCSNSDASCLIQHNDRTTKNSSNEDIHPELTPMNYSLTPPNHGESEYDYFLKRKSEVYCYPRKGVINLCSIICTLPSEIPLEDKEQIQDFFAATNDFLVTEFGGENAKNVISCWVHFDEGKYKPVIDRFTKRPVLDANGDIKMTLEVGRPHMHFLFIPAIKVDLDFELSKQWHDPKIEQYSERLCAAKILTRNRYVTFHDKWQSYLIRHGITARVKTGITKAQGGNISVGELKRRFTFERMELDRLREIERNYNNIISRYPDLADIKRGRFD